MNTINIMMKKWFLVLVIFTEIHIKLDLKIGLGDEV